MFTFSRMGGDSCISDFVLEVSFSVPALKESPVETHMAAFSISNCKRDELKR